MKLFNHAYYSDWKWFKSNPIQALHLEWLVDWLIWMCGMSKAERELYDKYWDLDEKAFRQKHQKLMATRYERHKAYVVKCLWHIKFASIKWMFTNWPK